MYEPRQINLTIYGTKMPPENSCDLKRYYFWDMPKSVKNV